MLPGLSGVERCVVAGAHKRRWRLARQVPIDLVNDTVCGRKTFGRAASEVSHRSTSSIWLAGRERHLETYVERAPGAFWNKTGGWLAYRKRRKS